MAAGRPVQTAQDIHQRRFSRPRRPHHRHELAGEDLERDPPQGVHLDFTQVVDLVHALETNEGCIAVRLRTGFLCSCSLLVHSSPLRVSTAPSNLPAPTSYAAIHPDRSSALKALTHQGLAKLGELKSGRASYSYRGTQY